ncbi:hypothetical protein [Hymenobacter sp. YC55]|uniref:hypothetical protein n=1 Tax=Hymenobacter sp. YC55 TaxID=3034019 RepID=UPI0023F9D2EF|nr:hypothetical protein [Hymenobacter sp. YC55]MDF7815335.1 hypothetical protein [Hymenobacter sp. YC55]
MCDFFAFRDNAKAAFSTLIVSVMMYEKGSGMGGEIVMYRVKVAGMAIGEDLTSEGPNPEEVLTNLRRKVGAARRVKKAADNARELARRNAAQVAVVVAMVVPAAMEPSQAMAA